MTLTFTQIVNRPMTKVATGTTRWNATSNQMEMFDGYQWLAVSTGYVKDQTLQDMVEYAEDQIAVTIEEFYNDNATIQDAFKIWAEANERFRVVLAIAEKK